MRWLAFIVVLGTSTYAVTASAQDSNRLLAYLALGAGGEVTYDPDPGGQVDLNLDASVGLGLRYEILLGDLFSVAPMFEWLTYEIDEAFFSSDREHIIDLDVFLKLRGKVRAGNTDLEIYGGIPIGFSVATREDDDALLGFNLGVMAGIAAFFGKFGVFLEVGWRGHQVWRDDERYGANQAGINLGGAIAL